MNEVAVFISYSHADEWLKDEFIKHLAALKRSGVIDVWHDRLIPAGKILDEEIDSKVATSHVFLFLISPDFIHSDYCFCREYRAALARRDAGDAEIIPVIVRDCDWDVDRLRSFNALPPDATPVTRNGAARQESERRDTAWHEVVKGLKLSLKALKLQTTPPKLDQSYMDGLFKVDSIRHPLLQHFDERLVFVDPDIYFENDSITLSSFDTFADAVMQSDAAIVTGPDGSGKTVIAKTLQARLDHGGFPAVLITGNRIRNAAIIDTIETEIVRQYGKNAYPRRRYTIVIDDFDECRLNDRVKEKLIRDIYSKYGRCVLLSFSNAPSVLLAADDLPDPAIFKIEPISNGKTFQLVTKWKTIGLGDTDTASDRMILATFEKLQLILGQTEVDRSPYTAITFLGLLESLSGSDLTFSSFASCYDALLVNRLNSRGVPWQSFDEAKNFLSLVAYKAYIDNESPVLGRRAFEECIETFELNYLSSPAALRKATMGSFLKEDGDKLCFYEEYLWFFLCARYVANTLCLEDRTKYIQFVDKCASNIFLKKYANIIIYLAYFSSDDFVLSSLLAMLDGLFSKADDWILSDDARSLMLGIATQDKLLIESRADVSENRVELLKERMPDFLGNAEKIIARYTLPFLNSEIADSAYVEGMSDDVFDPDSYLQSVNALLRTHSVIGQILGGRAGTYGSKLVLDCITRMVEASGRYAYLNHAIATVLIYDKDSSIKQMDQIVSGEALTAEDKFQKVMRLFSFWSVYLSQAGLARYLSHEHSIRALEKLVAEYENGALQTKDGNAPFNFTSVLMIARLFHTGKLDKPEIDRAVEKYGEHSALMALLRVAIHIYAYYMPMSIQDKQWVADKLNMPLKRIEMQRVKATGTKLPS